MQKIIISAANYVCARLGKQESQEKRSKHSFRYKTIKILHFSPCLLPTRSVKFNATIKCVRLIMKSFTDVREFDCFQIHLCMLVTRDFFCTHSYGSQRKFEMISCIVGFHVEHQSFPIANLLNLVKL